MNAPKKSLGQHWLKDPQALEAIAEYAEINSSDVVLEVGPGQGALTNYLTTQAGRVVAVELDENLTIALKSNASNNLEVVQGSILDFNLTSLPTGYKVVANIPYYLTNKLLKMLAESKNPPITMVLLVQKEVAERICAQPGQMSILSISVQIYYQPQLGITVPAKSFEPPPKVDSQVVILRRHEQQPFADIDTKLFFRVVKAGFSAKRKKIQTSLAGGLVVSKDASIKILKEAGIDPSLRAQNLSLQDWYNLHIAYRSLL